MKRIISLILLIVFTALSAVPAYAAEDEAVITNNAGNLSFLSALGIVEAPADGNAPVTRGELAKMFYRILISKYVPDFSDYKMEFSDVKEEDVEAIRACAALGIMNGVGNGSFGTDNPVTYIQATKALVSFLGYTVKAEAMGGWPTGYQAVAIDLDILTTAPSDLNSYLTYNGAGDLFRYAAEAPIMESYGNDTHIVEKDVTYLSHYLNIIRGSGIITANSITNFDGEPLPYGQIAINGEVMKLTEDSVQVSDLIGQTVELFCVEDGNKYQVLYYELGDNNVYTIDDESIISVDYDKYVYENADGKEKKVTLDKRAMVVYNNTICDSFDTDILNPYADGTYNGMIKCVDNNGDTKADIIFVEAYETMVVGAVKDGLISSKVRYGMSIDINEYEDVNINFLNVAGQPILASTIAEGDVLTYYRDLNDKITRVYVTVESSTGKIDYLIKENDIIEGVSVGGVEYECSNGVSRNPDNVRLNPGMFVTVYFDRYGKISDMEAASFDGALGLLVDYKANGGMLDTHMVKIFGADSRFKTFTLAKKIKVNESEVIKPEDFLALCGTDSSTKKIKRQVVKYSANANGELNAIVIADAKLDSNGEYMSDFFIYKNYDGTVAHRYTDVFSCFDLQIYPGGNSKTFVIPPEDKRDNDNLYKIGYSFKDGQSPMIVAYGDDKTSARPVAILYVTSEDTSENLSTNDEIFAVDRVAQRIDEEGEEVIELVGWTRTGSNVGKLMSIEIADIDSLRESLGGNLPEAGDIIKYGTDIEGKIEKAAFVFDYSDKKLCGDFAGNPNIAYNVTGNRFVYGDIIYNDGNIITMEIVSDGGVVTYESYPLSRITTGGATFVRNNQREDGKFKVTANNDIFDRQSYGDGCSEVLIFTSGKWWYCAFVYND